MHKQENTAFAIWWMNPAYIFTILMGLMIAGAFMISPENYISFYRVDKFINNANIWYCILPAICFIAGSIMASSTNKAAAPSTVFADTVMNRDAFIKACIYILFALTMFGYLVWFLIMVKNGFSLNLFLDVLKGKPGAIYEITENFEKVTGVTSFTNFGIPFTILAVYYQCLKQKKTFLHLLIAVAILTLIRSIFFSERLAIMEIIVPALIIFISIRHKNRQKLPFLKLYPLVSVAAIVGFFAIGEYFRSWVSYYQYVYPSFWEFIIIRFYGYYITAMNTGTLYLNELGFQSLPFPYFTWEWIWKFPGLPADAYPSLFGIVPGAAMDNTLQTMGNPEFNNPSGLLLPYHDYGFIGALIFWLLLGFISGLLYVHFKKGCTFGMIMYPIWIVGILEIPRYLYFSGGRFYPCWIILLLFALAIHYNKKKIAGWQIAGVRS